jgi:pyruvate carboxylase subunit B
VKFGRWKMISQPAQDVVLGKYGSTPGPVDQELLTLVEKQSGKKAVTVRPADLLDPGMPTLRNKLKEKGLPEDDETAVLFAMFPVETERLLRGEKPAEQRTPAAAAPARSAPLVSPVTTHPSTSGGRPKRYLMHVEGQKHVVEVEEVS